MLGERDDEQSFPLQLLRDLLEAVDHVRALAAIYNVRELVYDPWRSGRTPLSPW